MKQLDLFPVEDYSQPLPPIIPLTDWEWEDSQPPLDRNKGKPPPPTPPPKNKKVFDNKPELSERAVSEYQPGGTASKAKKYFRFSYRINNKVNHVHIKGGNVQNERAIRNKNQVESWILQGLSTEEIVNHIKAF